MDSGSIFQPEIFDCQRCGTYQRPEKWSTWSRGWASGDIFMLSARGRQPQLKTVLDARISACGAMADSGTGHRERNACYDSANATRCLKEVLRIGVDNLSFAPLTDAQQSRFIVRLPDKLERQWQALGREAHGKRQRGLPGIAPGCV